MEYEDGEGPAKPERARPTEPKKPKDGDKVCGERVHPDKKEYVPAYPGGDE